MNFPYLSTRLRENYPPKSTGENEASASQTFLPESPQQRSTENLCPQGPGSIVQSGLLPILQFLEANCKVDLPLCVCFNRKRFFSCPNYQGKTKLLEDVYPVTSGIFGTGHYVSPGVFIPQFEQHRVTQHQEVAVLSLFFWQAVSITKLSFKMKSINSI